MAKENRERAEASDSDRMRFRLACSAEAWSVRANLREFNRVQIENEASTDGPGPNGDDNQIGAT